uniref:Uncharacterized protein n=1 Tax=Megaviridae environmental sample TaxID=1737588 RepID=A0A5J6VIB3_9VIRU|nr:MAG: hypothetical protein [Megaviridae environmental sample]
MESKKCGNFAYIKNGIMHNNDHITIVTNDNDNLNIKHDNILTSCSIPLFHNVDENIYNIDKKGYVVLNPNDHPQYCKLLNKNLDCQDEITKGHEISNSTFTRLSKQCYRQFTAKKHTMLEKNNKAKKRNIVFKQKPTSIPIADDMMFEFTYNGNSTGRIIKDTKCLKDGEFVTSNDCDIYTLQEGNLCGNKRHIILKDDVDCLYPHYVFDDTVDKYHKRMHMKCIHAVALDDIHKLNP